MNTEGAALAVLLLAAGKSSRFGEHKLLAKCCGKPIIAHMRDALRCFEGSDVYAVTGHQAADIEAQLSGINCIRFSKFSQGMGASISFGVNKILQSRPTTQHILILLADQVAIERQHLEAFVTYYREHCSEGNVAQTAQWENHLTGGPQTSPPAILPRCDFHALKRLSGDRGAGDILKRAREENRLVAYPLPQAAIDIDTAEDLQRFEAFNPWHQPENN